MKHNGIYLSSKTLISLSIIQFLILASVATIGFQFGSQNISADPSGVETAGLPISKGGTNAVTEAAARTNLSVFSKAESDSRFVRSYGWLSSVSYATVSALGVPSTKFASFAGSGATFPNSNNFIVNMYNGGNGGSGADWITLIATDMSNGDVFTNNSYNSGDPSWVYQSDNKNYPTTETKTGEIYNGKDVYVRRFTGTTSWTGSDNRQKQLTTYAVTNVVDSGGTIQYNADYKEQLGSAASSFSNRVQRDANNNLHIAGFISGGVSSQQPYDIWVKYTK
jgi:hypothetical protein